MIRRILFIGSLCSLLVLLFLALNVNAGGGIVVNNADNLETNSLSSSATLFNLLTNVANRIATEYSDALEHIGLSAPPTELNTHLTNIIDRVATEYSDGIRHISLPTLPATLNTRLSNVANRVAFEYADKNRKVATLIYPKDMIDDTDPPEFTNEPEVFLSSNNVIINWGTNEFANFTLKYGTSPSTYDEEVSNKLYYETHQATLTGLDLSKTYYYQITLTDLSGNQFISSEFEIEGTYNIYLPMIIK